ncbi:hypothetical protein EPA93_36575 [Ktedonosporobacter rubrisoli]|uniref:BON domain-containing protein n=1 Tax=Ktedonosporobacter rubrisoli TaxID=2509675 RepID=A0A4P6JZF7_KTERU|nr:hypothetical protein [Ktedonosporobacter rubrisoli]QBD81197.1 hypothetical protein EPA93_36575 [Ktedonosporobacter rubrisoli]
METSLQSTNLSEDELKSLNVDQEIGVEEEESHHIHLPNPSLWPLILSAAILITIAGLLFIPDTPYLAILGGILVLVGILGWGLEDPFGGSHAASAEFSGPIVATKVLDEARELVEHSVTVSSTAYSTHPVKVELDQESSEGVILALYGKVELEAQRQELEDELRQLPGVLDVRNFVVAEDVILNLANARMEKLRADGKLEGSQDLSILVENYILHLYGNVPSNNMKYMLEREMIGIPGVRVVVNHIGLNKEIPGNLGKTRNKI